MSLLGCSGDGKDKPDDTTDTTTTGLPGAGTPSTGLPGTGMPGTGQPTETTWYADADGDGYGDPAYSVDAVTRPTGYVANSDDCDDADPASHPGAFDTARDGIDQDCVGGDDDCSGPRVFETVLDATTQADVEDFCSRANQAETLYVIDSDLVDLTSVSCLCETNSLYVQGNTRLTSLQGLEQLVVSDSYAQVSITGNPALTSIDLQGDWPGETYLYIEDNPSLTTVRLPPGDPGQLVWAVTISNNAALTTVQGLENSQGTGGLNLRDNPQLTSALLFDSAATLDQLYVQNCPLLTQGPLAPNVGTITNYSIRDAGYTTLPVVATGSVTEITLLELSGTQVTDLTDLDGVSSIDRVLLHGNTQLTTLDGLHVRAMPASISISGNPLLTDLSALSVVTTINGRLSLKENGIPTLAGLENLTTVGILVIQGNQSLTSLAPLGNVTTLHGTVEIGADPTGGPPNGLTDLQGLEGLTTIGSELVLVGSNVSSLAGLENLDTLGGNLYIRECPNLTDMNALWGLQSVGDVWITDNPALPAGHVGQWVTDVGTTAATGTMYVYGNGP